MGIQKLDRHEAYFPIDPAAPFAVAPLGANNSRHESPVAVVILNVPVVGDRIPSKNIIDIAIGVVVYCIVRDFPRVMPNIRFEITHAGL